MKTSRRTFVQLGGAAISVTAISMGAKGQAYPSRPITVIVPFAAGGSGDLVARIVAEPMRSALRQPVIIENVGGADGKIGTDRAARARPDGYTIDFGIGSTHVLNASLFSLPYDVTSVPTFAGR
jgi:tripartite-type tricarboxylate transporter receptor subunit TctC